MKGEGPCWSSERKSHEFFVRGKSGAVEKNVPAMGALRRAPSSLGPSAQNLEPKS